MKRRKFIQLSAMGAISGLSSSFINLKQESVRKPNIVMIVSDDQGWRDVGYHGAEFETPNIDKIANEGVELNRFYVCPICSPTRVGLMTGRYPIRYGLQRVTIKEWGTRALPKEEVILPEMLAKAGYKRRGAFGKWHLGQHTRPFHPINQGFTHFYGHYGGAIDYFTHENRGALDWHRQFDLSYDEGYSTQLIGKESVQFIKESASDDPFFLYAAFNAIHTPNHVLEDYMKRFEHIKDNKRRQKAAMVACMDDEIGKILQALDEKEIAEDTLVLFFSDNGGVKRAGSNNLPLRGGKWELYEGGIRVPAAIRWPNGLKGARKLDIPLSYIDIFPTLGSIVGIPSNARKNCDGDDVYEILQRKSQRDDWEFHSYFQGKKIKQNKDASLKIKYERNAVNTSEWKLVRLGPNLLLVDDPIKDAEISLFRIDEDPFEEKNLIAENPHVVKKLLKKMVEFRRLQPDNVESIALNPPAGWKKPKTWKIPEE